MQNLTLSWQASGGAAVVAYAAALPLRRRMPRFSPLLREAGTLLALFALWQFAGRWSLFREDGAVARGQWIWNAERRLHLPSEAALQRAALPHHWLVEGANYYYAVMHFGVMLAFLLWLFLRHRAVYGRVRTTLVLVTGASLLVQLIPVAPPRLLPGDGMADTALEYGQSVYAGAGEVGVTADSYAAMPSVHVAWCVLVAVAVIAVSRSRWRWLVIAHPVATVAVVVLTANHFWLDGVAAVLLLALSWGVQSAARAALGRRRSPQPPVAVVLPGMRTPAEPAGAAAADSETTSARPVADTR